MSGAARLLAVLVAAGALGASVAYWRAKRRRRIVKQPFGPRGERLKAVHRKQSFGFTGGPWKSTLDQRSWR